MRVVTPEASSRSRPSTGFSRLWNSLRWLIALPSLFVVRRSGLAVAALVAALADRDQRRLLARDLRLDRLEQGGRGALRKRHHAVLVADHDVARRYHRPADRDRHVDLARPALVGPRWITARAKHGKSPA